MAGTVSADLDGLVGVVELLAPEPNYLDAVLLEDLVDALAGLSAEPRCRVLILCTTGRHFCAGANFGEDGIGADRPRVAERLYAAAARLFDPTVVTAPVIAAVQGAAVGAGLGLACSADFRVAARSARFHANFARLGFHPGFGLSVTLPNLLGQQHAQQLLYGGQRVDGERAASIGLVDRLAEPGSERAVARVWADELAEAAPLAVRSMRQTLRTGLAQSVAEGLRRELVEQSRLWQTADSDEGIAAAAERRAPAFEGR